MACYIVFGTIHNDFQNNIKSIQIAPLLSSKKIYKGPGAL